jgi:flagellar hook assembly protein FlgD
VRIDQAQRIDILGRLDAIGTAAQPIVFAAKQAAPTAGYWRALLFRSGSSASRVSYATISHGGQNHSYSGYSSIYVDGSSPTFDHVTVTNSATSGIKVVGAAAAPTITNSTITANIGSGVRVEAPAMATITDTILSNNGFAIEAWANSRLAGLTGLTVSGNGGGAKDGVAHNGGTITGAETWLPGIEWHLWEDLFVGSNTNTAASLTIAAGTTVRMDQYQKIDTFGQLSAVGSPALPILITSKHATPTAGYWRAILLRPGSSPSSQLAYLTLAYGGRNDVYSGLSSLYVEGCTPVLDHISVLNSQTNGLRAVNAGALLVRNAVFAGNGSNGIENSTPTLPIQAELSYWSSASGPGGAGGGAGQGISAGVTFQPWLLAPPAPVHYFSAATTRNSTFNPSLGVPFKTDFTSTLAGAWSATVRDGVSSVVRTLAGSGSAATVIWDGKDSSGSVLPAGTYTVDLESTAGSGEIAAPARSRAVLDPTRQLTIIGSALSQAFFSPNGDAVQDATAFSGGFSFDDVDWQLDVRDAGNASVRSASGNGDSFAFSWDGRNGAGVLQPDGPYTLVAVGSIGSASGTASVPTVLDNTPPLSVISSPSAGQVLSNVYQNGSTDVSVLGTATDTNFTSWTSEYGAGVAPAAWTALRTATAPLVSGEVGPWLTAPLPNGAYVLRLRAADKAGNLSSAAVATTVGNFKAAQSLLEFNPSNAQSQTYTSTVPFALSETLVIKNASGQIVRTLVPNVSRPAGDYADTWNGRNDSNVLVPDGPYFYVATASAGTSSMTWDLSSAYLANWSEITHNLPIQAFDPFNNSPMTVTYNFSSPARVSIALSQSSVLYQGNCNPPQFCIVTEEYQESGLHTVTWASVDATGAFRGDILGIGIVADRNQFAKNAVIAYGSKPRVTNVRVTPPVFGPAVGSQQVEFDLTTNLSQPVQVAVSFLNQSSLSTLRTITVPVQPPGHVTVPWDGRANNGMFVAPGYYTVTVVVTDALGNESRGQILTTIQY